MGTTRWIDLEWMSDATANDSDKTLVVPAGRVWIIHAIALRLVSTADVGNRLMTVLMTDTDNNPLLTLQAGAVQAASVTRDYFFNPGNPQETAFTNAVMLRAMPSGLALPATSKVRAYDSAAIAATADDLTVRVLAEILRR